MTISILTFLYFGVGIASVLGFVPQIARLAKDTSGAESVSIASFLLWSANAGITALYGHVVTDDRPIAIINSIAFCGCAAIAFLAIRNRFRHRDIQLGATSDLDIEQRS